MKSNIKIQSDLIRIIGYTLGLLEGVRWSIEDKKINGLLGEAIVNVEIELDHLMSKLNEKIDSM